MARSITRVIVEVCIILLEEYIARYRNTPMPKLSSEKRQRNTALLEELHAYLTRSSRK